MINPPLACTVRGCGQPLARVGPACRCPRGHSYDVARAGYVNLLQPQDRKATTPGDARAAVDARVTLEQAGVGDALVAAIVERLSARPLPAGAVVLDLGCGTGHALARVCSACGADGIGIDLSAAAIGLAARRHPELTWVVANADRRLPILDGRVDVVLSLHARRNAAECARVLAPGGVLVVAVPAPDDLAELRAEVQGAATVRDRAERVLVEHQPAFALRERVRVAETRCFERPALLALLQGTYRGARFREAARAASLEARVVTLAADVCVFEPAPTDRPRPAGSPTIRGAGGRGHPSRARQR